MVKLLIANGTDLTIEDDQTVFVSNSIEMIKFLVESGARVSSPKNRALSFSVDENNLEITQLLINLGADASLNYPLSRTFYHGNLNMIKLLLDNGASISNSSLRIYSSRENTLEIIKYVLSLRTDPTITKNDNWMIYAAINNGNLELLKLLLNFGADFYTKDERYMEDATHWGQLEIMKFFIQLGIYTQEELNNCLVIAAGSVELETIQYLINVGADITSEVISVASICGNLSIVKFLISLGVDITPRVFINACYADNIQLVKYLIDMGADIHVEDDKAITSTPDIKLVKLLVDLGVNAFAHDNQAIINSARHGNLEIVQYLVSLGVDSKAKNKALIKAAKYGNFSIVKFLLDSGADISDNKALINSSNVKITKILIKHGADILADNNQALINSCENCDKKTAKLLIKHGTNVQAQDNLPIILFSKYKCIKMVKLLHKLGANVCAQDNRAIKYALEFDNYSMVKLLEELGASSKN